MQSKPAIRVVALALAGALLLSFATLRSCWPIVPFDMYARTQLDGFNLIVLEGVDDQGHTFAVSGTRFLAPYSDAMEQTLLSQGALAGPRRFREILGALEDQYQRRWISAGRPGPRLARLRAYVGTWRPDRKAWRQLLPPTMMKPLGGYE